MQGNQFYAMDATLSVDDIRIASLYIRRGALVKNNTVSGGFALPPLATTTNAANPSGQGTFTDPEDPKLVVSYHFDGTRISIGSIFTACLDGLAEVPQHYQEDMGVLINAESASGDCTITLRGIDLKWRLAGKVMLYIYSNIMLIPRTFGGMRFVVTYNRIDLWWGVVAKV